MASVKSNCPRCGAALVPGAKGCLRCKAKAGAPARRSRRSALMAGLAMMVIGVAGLVIYLNWPAGGAGPVATAQQPQAAKPAEEPAPEILERAAARSRLAILRIGEGENARTVVALGKPAGPMDHNFIKTNDQSILGRELIRQALLIAARDELGLATRDEVLDDTPPGKAEGPTIEVTSVFDAAGRQATIRRGDGDKVETLLRRNLGPTLGDQGMLGRTTVVAEELSRSGFPDALKSLGLKGTRNTPRGDAGLPAKVEERLAQLGFIEQIAALRDLHAAIRADGESPERVGALARGYAQLGVLSEFHWHPAHKAFKARALLYAQRLVAHDSGSGWALANRAFVKALVGIPTEALDDAARAKVLEKTPPDWLGLIEAYAKGDAAGMEVKEGPHARLAALLRLFSVEYPPHSALVLRSAREVLSADAECYRAHDTMCRVGGVSNLHVATAFGPDVLTRLLPAKLKAVGTLPPSVKVKLNGRGNELDVVAAMTSAGASGEDAGEPSWGVLAHLVRETRFIQVYRRLHFMTKVWSVPVDEYWADVRPFVADHRYRPFLETFALPPQEVRETYGAFVNGFDPTDFDVHEIELSWSFNGYVTSRPPHDWTYAMGHSDATVRDFSEVTHVSSGLPKTQHAKQLLEINPRSAFAMATLVENDWAQAEAKLPAWEKTAGESAVLLGALGRHYTNAKEFDEASKALNRYIKVSPDAWAFEMLADNYKAQGDLDRWKEMLDEYLAKGEDHGLHFAHVRVEIARYYMGLKDWARAKTYADAAAETWAEWAMICAAEANEAAGDWDRAELWTRRTSERYPNPSWPGWYLFCKRTGHGDLEAARDWTERYVASVEGRPDLVNPEIAAYFSWSSGSPKIARDYLGKLYAVTPTALLGLQLATVCDELGDNKKRDAVLEEVCNELKGQAPKTFEICGMIRDSLSNPGKKPLDVEAVDKIILSIPAGNRWPTEFFVGKYLMNHGKAEAGRKYLKQCADFPGTLAWIRVIAADALKSAGQQKRP
jgi:tetratricopeptide (TPR) repeat protein